MDQPAPTPIVPVPAAQFRELRGRRIIIGVPGVGFRGDLRADDPVVQGSRTFVPVLAEHDYYRAETEQTEVFAALVPIERVWVEELRDLSLRDAPQLDAPQHRRPSSAQGAGPLLGRRVVQSVADGFVRDLRAISEPYLSTAGRTCVRVCAEAEWYEWAINGSTPPSTEVAFGDLWVE
jgi:hypothetical protein